MYLSALEPHFQVMEPCGDPQHHHATYSVNVISGGQAYNQIPGHAQAEVEIRIMPPVTTAQIDALVRGVAAIHAGITLTQLSAAEPTSIDPDNPYVKLFGRTIEHITARQPKFVTSHGGSDSSFFIGAGIPVIMSGPPAGGHHSVSEWVDVAGLEQFYQILREFTQAASKL
jgi:acetylornithine deacetylase/succinyl-diaminopimelate desuccinylase-like protein